MQERHYKTILYFIIAAILGTLAMQGYWNYKNFEAGKQQLINDVQNSLNDAVDSYYATRAEESIKNFTIVEELSPLYPTKQDTQDLESLKKSMERIDSITHKLKGEISINVDLRKGAEEITMWKKNDSNNIETLIDKIKYKKDLNDSLFFLNKDKDTLYPDAISKITSQIVYSFFIETLDLETLDSLFTKNLSLKKINIEYQLATTQEEAINVNTNSIASPYFVSNPELSSTSEILKTTASSDFLKPNQDIYLSYTNTTSTILKKNLISYLLSLLFVIAIISCLLYLLRIIKNQKQLAEVKNDLISNITHEFKTPLATIGAAMEGVQLFNKNNDVEKTQRYAKVATTQVSKLTTMVEKLLETATLDSENLELNIEETDLVHLLKTVTTKEAVLASSKGVSFKTYTPTLLHPVDPFHFENALNNLLDNALKYGGDTIEVSITRNKNTTEIIISDNGNELTNAQSKQIFEKFYRVPKGNTHDVKGFGIGLYYTKAIVEKHGGTIEVQVKPTTFKITLS